jgi:hypothetical protein
MLKLIEGSYASFFPKEMDAMFRNRAETFSARIASNPLHPPIITHCYISSRPCEQCPLDPRSPP